MKIINEDIVEIGIYNSAKYKPLSFKVGCDIEKWENGEPIIIGSVEKIIEAFYDYGDHGLSIIEVYGGNNKLLFATPKKNIEFIFYF